MCGGSVQERFSHPAFGAISMSVVNGGDPTLFGSDIGHSQRIRITVKRAERIRNLSNDRIYASGPELVEIEMSHGQFAEFITSANRGDGIPCTLVRAAPEGTRYESTPGILKEETKLEIFKREVAQSAEKHLESMRAEIAKLGAIIESGKFSKVEMRALHNNLSREAAYLPPTLSFVVGQAEEALEKAATHSKVEVEAFINYQVHKLGLGAAQALGLVNESQPLKEIE
jgi:hypothetical protein